MEVGKVEFERRVVTVQPGVTYQSQPMPLELPALNRLVDLEKAFASALARIQALEGDLAAMQERQDAQEAELEGVSETTRVMWQRGDYA